MQTNNQLKNMRTQNKIACWKLASGIASTMAVLLVAGCASDRPEGSQNALVPQDDQTIVARVQDTLRMNPEYPYAAVSVSATNGNVVLTGAVAEAWQRYNAAAIAARVPGVKVVANHLAVLYNNAPTSVAHE
jgi:hypothetical protein